MFIINHYTTIMIYAANTSFMFQPIVYLLYIFLNYGGTMHYI